MADNTDLDDLSKVLILIVDDEPSIRKLLQRILAVEGFLTTAASNGKEALQKLQEMHVSLVITDIAMPQMDGLELTEKIKAGYDTDVIVVTGQTETYHYEELISLGASDFIGKPINPNEIVLRIKRVLNERKLRAELVKYHEELAQSQKFESIGLLAAGIAHEINTPIQYIGDNTVFMKESFEEMISVMDDFKSFYDQVKKGEVDNSSIEKMAKTIEEADLEYLSEEIPIAADQSLDGVKRVRKIVQSMKEFSHPGSDEKSMVDLHHIIENTVTVTINEWKYCADLSLDFIDDMPKIYCDPSEISQVFLNMIINASHAIMEKVGVNASDKGKISISTRKSNRWADIRISDTGNGIPKGNISKIFDPFFTTKEVGKGTGQGLAISRSVIVDRHKGRLEIETEAGEGTCFIIRLPMTHAGDNQDE